jgi:hypothetical protein
LIVSSFIDVILEVPGIGPSENSARAGWLHGIPTDRIHGTGQRRGDRRRDSDCEQPLPAACVESSGACWGIARIASGAAHPMNRRGPGSGA